jgi:hypothetical protein
MKQTGFGSDEEKVECKSAEYAGQRSLSLEYRTFQKA